MALQFRYNKALQSKPSSHQNLRTIFQRNSRTEVNITIPGSSRLPYLTHIPMGFTSFEFPFKANTLHAIIVILKQRFTSKNLL